MIWLLPPPLSRQQAVSLPQPSFVSLVELLTGEGGGSGESLSFSVFLCVAGQGAKLYDRDKAWPSRNHSILSEYPDPSLVISLDPTKCERSKGAIKTY